MRQGVWLVVVLWSSAAAAEVRLPAEVGLLRLGTSMGQAELVVQGERQRWRRHPLRFADGTEVEHAVLLAGAAVRVQLHFVADKLARIRVEDRSTCGDLTRRLGAPTYTGRQGSAWMQRTLLRALRSETKSQRCELIDLTPLLTVTSRAVLEREVERLARQLVPPPLLRAGRLPGLWIAAALACLIAVGLALTLLFSRGLAGHRAVLLVAAAVSVPMCAVAYHVVRLRVIALVQHVLGRHRAGLLAYLNTFYAPLTEEPAKLAALLVPAVRRSLSSAPQRAHLALALGVGFGIGEIWVVAHALVRVDQFAGEPWYAFTGFVTERLMVCAIHSAFTMAVVRRVGQGTWAVFRGLALAMLLHYAGNFPIYLREVNIPPFGAAVWNVVLGLWVPLFGAFIFVKLIVEALPGPYVPSGKVTLGERLYGRARCPSCATEYARPLLRAINMKKRYERCPACRRWHWTVALPRQPQ